MFKSNNSHLLHKEAIDLIAKTLPGAVSMDSLVGYHTPYHIEWNGLKLLVKVARPSKKKRTDKWQSGQKLKWFYSLRVKDHKVVDFFVLFCLYNSEIEALYVIPKVVAPKYYITVTRLNGNMRYEYFKTTLAGLANKIVEINNSLPRLKEIYIEAKRLKGGDKNE